MKKKTITIGALLLAMNSFSQTDTIEFGVVGKNKLTFDYGTSKITNITKHKKHQDITFELKKNEYLCLDLFDDLAGPYGAEKDSVYFLYRNVTVYYRNGYVGRYYYSSNKNTLKVDGNLIEKVIVHKPKLK